MRWLISTLLSARLHNRVAGNRWPLNRAKSYRGAPRPMKMGTTASPWRYDAAADETIRPDNQRRTAILRYALWATVFPISLVVRLPFDSGPFDQSRDRRDGPTAEVGSQLHVPSKLMPLNYSLAVDAGTAASVECSQPPPGQS
jgi:hypothetical protein